MKNSKTTNNIAISRPFCSLAAAPVLASLVALCGGQNARATIYTLSISSTVPWTDTGINVAAGSELEVTASGTVAYGLSPGQSCGPNGGDLGGPLFLSDSVYPGAVSHSLIGKTGGTTAIGDGTPVPEGTPGDGTGFVGASYNEIISTGGELFLGFNDEVGGFGDNSGSFSVTVDVLPVPEPSVAAFFGLGVLALFARRIHRSNRALPH